MCVCVCVCLCELLFVLIYMETNTETHTHMWFKTVLRKGTYYLLSTLALTQQDSYTLIQNYESEQVIISGGMPLNTHWKPYPSAPHIYQTEVSFALSLAHTHTRARITSAANVEITGLRADGERVVRARYPNANPETDVCVCLCESECASM